MKRLSRNSWRRWATWLAPEGTVPLWALFAIGLIGVPIRNAPGLGLKHLGTAFIETSPVEVHVHALP